MNADASRGDVIPRRTFNETFRALRRSIRVAKIGEAQRRRLRRKRRSGSSPKDALAAPMRIPRPPFRARGRTMRRRPCERASSLALDVRIKRAFEPPLREDGLRVLVDRLWPRGLRKEAAAIDLWIKDLAPSSDLRVWFGHDPARWDDFRRLYLAELASRRALLDALRRSVAGRRLTLIYAARDEIHNQAAVLRDLLLAVASPPDE
jgi:uncharacterized protein YeaO (DUF488 family)